MRTGAFFFGIAPLRSAILLVTTRHSKRSVWRDTVLVEPGQFAQLLTKHTNVNDLLVSAMHPASGAALRSWSSV